MARKKKDDDQRALPNHNIKDLNKLMRECAREANRIKAERKELNEQMKDVRERLRGAGIQTKPFEFACRVAAMEAEAQGSYIDWLKVSFEALGVGMQGDFFPETKPQWPGDATDTEDADAGAEPSGPAPQSEPGAPTAEPPPPA